MKHSKETRRQRALDLRALLGRNSHLFTLEDVCNKAGVNYKSTANAIGKLVKYNDSGVISDERLTALEDAAIGLEEKYAEQEADLKVAQ